MGDRKKFQNCSLVAAKLVEAFARAKTHFQFERKNQPSEVLLALRPRFCRQFFFFPVACPCICANFRVPFLTLIPLVLKSLTSNIFLIFQIIRATVALNIYFL